MRKLELYYSPGAASLVLHWLLIELNLPHLLHALDLSKAEHKSADYLLLNPAGVVPTLLIDGKAITEAAAICLHLADSFKGSRLAPVPGTFERARYYQWMFFCANTLQPAYRTWFYPAEVAGVANADAAKDAARSKIEAAWHQVEAHLATTGPYLLGAQMTTVDFMLTMLMRWSRNMPTPAHTSPVLADYAARMKSLPSFAELYAREGLTEWA